MKGILEFDLNDPDDIMSHLRCVKSSDLGSCFMGHIS